MDTILAQKYRVDSRPLLSFAFEELERGDLRQASEKSWCSVTLALKSIAELRDIEHRSHNSLYSIAGMLADEAADDDIYHMFLVASGLHTNFYEDNCTSATVRSGLRQVQRLLEKLERFY